MEHTYPYQNSILSITERVEDLLSHMSIEEKVAQLCGDLASSFLEDGKLSHEKLKTNFPHGHGRFTQYSMVGLVDAEQIGTISNQLQAYFVNETRLGIPVVLQSENLCGYPGEGGTIFPAQINVGSTWNPALAKQMSAIIGQESRAVGISSAMSPVIDVSRDPRWGRTYETYGEDTYLISQMGISYIQGMQEQGVSCIAKHFLGYGETQGGLNAATTRINDRELYEVFATPFEAAYREAGLDAVMANYAEIDGLPVINNPKIARTLLRDTMGFDGMLISDGAALLKTFTFYKTAKTYKEAGLLALKGGCDTEIPVGNAFRQLPDYIKSGELDEKLLNDAVRRVLAIKFKRGLFENPYCDVDKIRVSMRDEKKEALSKEIAAQSLILLKNDGVLPIAKGKKVALIGPHANNLRYPVSGYTYPAYIEMMDAMKTKTDTVSFHGIMDEQTKAKKESLPKGPFDSLFEMLGEDAHKLNDMESILRTYYTRSLKEVLEERYELVYSEGCPIIKKDRSQMEKAVELARESDVVVMALGGNCGWVDVTGGEGKDRSKLDLPGLQLELLKSVAELGKPIVLVLYGPGIFSINLECVNVAGIIQAYMPGPFAADVVADVLDGTYNPGGKLSVTIPRGVGQIPCFYNHKNGSGYMSGGDPQASSTVFSGGYVDESDKPLFAFGHGLSYTTFSISDFEIENHEVEVGDRIQLSCILENTGDVAGDEVLQLYYADLDAHVVRPNRQLAGFLRVHVNPKEKKKVIFVLDTAQLGFYDENMEFVVEPGQMMIMIGTSALDIKYSTTIALIGKTQNVMGKRVYSAQVFEKTM